MAVCWYKTNEPLFSCKNFGFPKGNRFIQIVEYKNRVDLITGAGRSHTGTDTDIACSEGSPILAAADVTVTVANGLDSLGGSYGYYIQIDHGGGL